MKTQRKFLNSKCSILYLILCFVFCSTSNFAQSRYDNQTTITIGTVPTVGFYPTGSNKTISARDKITIGKSSETTIINNTSGYTLTFETNNNIVPLSTCYATTIAIGGVNRTLDKSNCIPGSISGNLNITPGATVNYSIPIQIAPGSHGMQPTLSIDYTGQGSNGELGFGWYLSGISTIQKTNKNIYYDNEYTGIVADDPNFELDGQRLIRKSGDMNFATFTLENDPYTIVLYNKYEGFTVKSPDGTTSKYGGGGVNNWPLIQVIDAEGNFIEYTYIYGFESFPQDTLLSSEFHLSRIDYTGNSITGAKPYNSILFYYNSRDDINANPVSYKNSTLITQKVLLSSIKVMTDGSISKDYSLNYFKDTLTQYSKLNQIGLTADGIKYNPTIIDWGRYNYTDTVYSKDTVLGYNNFDIIRTGDIDGDGYNDIVRQHGTNGGNMGFRIHTTTATGIKGQILPFYTQSNKALSDINLVDWNNDGKDELLMHFTITTHYTIDPYNTDSVADYVMCYSFTNGVWTEMPEYRSISKQYPVHLGFTYYYKHFYHDINGDGNIERLSQYMSSRPSHYDGYITGISNYMGLKLGLQSFSLPAIDDIKMIDFDGDGQAELLTHSILDFEDRDTSVYQILKFQNNGLEVVSVKNIKQVDLSCGHLRVRGDTNLENDLPLQPQPEDVYTGDFNGDGFTDLLIKFDLYLKTYKTWNILYSNGYYFSQNDPSILNTYAFKNDKPTTVLIDDINSDGKSDILISVNQYPTSGNNLKLFLSNGLNFIRLKDSIPLAGSGKLILRTEKLGKVLNNITAEPKQIFWGSNSNKYFGIITFKSRLNGNNQITRITDGSNTTTTINYSYRKTATTTVQPSLALINLPGFENTKSRRVMNEVFVPTSVVTKTACNPDSSWSSYTFNDALTYPFGKGFLGYSRVLIKDGLTNTVTTTYYTPTISDDNGKSFIYMYPSSTSTMRAGILLSTNITLMKAKTSTPTTKQFFPLTISQSSIDGITQYNKTNTVSNFDITSGKVKESISVATGGWTTTSQATYVNVLDNVYKLTQSKTIKANNSDSYTNTTDYEYDQTKPLRLKKTINQQGRITSTITAWDNYGNPTEIVTQTNDSPQLPERKITMQYDAVGRFLLASTDALGLITRATYRPGDGAPLTQTDANGLTTTTEYSQYGNILQTTTTLPDGNVKTDKMGWASTGTGYCVTSAITNGNSQTQNFDCKAQLLSESSFGFNGQILTSTNDYNKLGQLITSITPSGTSTYSYDSLGRAKRTIGPGTDVEYSYAGSSTTITDKTSGMSTSGSVATKTIDALGNITNITATTGNIAYTYYASGKIKTVNAEGLLSTIEYDELLNQTKLIDPNAGTTIYNYNGYGELTKQTDANGQTTECTYTLGRLVKKQVTSTIGIPLTVNYDYYNIPGKLGLLKQISRNENGINFPITETYDYDALCRPILITTSGPNTQNVQSSTNYITRFEYNTSNGRLASQTYPTTLKINYLYDTYGNISQINNAIDNSPIWQGNTVNSLNQWTKYTMGNGLITQINYDAIVHLPTHIKSGTTGNSTRAFSMSYSYNNLGQTTSRTNNNANLTENFVYDNKDRLIQDGLTGNTHTYSYDNSGNITNTSVAGNFIYDQTSHPNAVTRVIDVPNTGAIPIAITCNTTYNTENKIFNIDNPNTSCKFIYGVNGNRFRVDNLVNNIPGVGSMFQYSKVFVGNSEFFYPVTGNAYKRSIIVAPTGVVAVWQDSSNIVSTNYIHTDNQGSWLAISNQSGNVTNSYSYDAWGRPRSTDKWELKPIDINNALVSLNSFRPRFDRGYTGHEIMAGFGLINMNGRIYDPYLQRMLSPDIVVQAPDNAQNYNRYSYCMNNPLRYTDPSGYEYGDPFNGGGSGCRPQGFENQSMIREFASPDGMNESGVEWFRQYDRDCGGFQDPKMRMAMLKLFQNFLKGNTAFDRERMTQFKFVFGATSVDDKTYKRTGQCFLINEKTLNVVNKQYLENMFGNSGSRTTNDRGGAYLAGDRKPQAGGGSSADNLFATTYAHFQTGGNEPITVKASSLDFGNVSQKNLKYNPKTGRYGLDLYKVNPTSQDALALGKISLVNQGGNQFSIESDYYDFNIEWQNGFTKRNIATAGAAILHYNATSLMFGGPFWINFQGTITIKP